ncbi:MAG: GAF domain-containing protein [Anaerolineales bacterium]
MLNYFADLNAALNDQDPESVRLLKNVLIVGTAGLAILAVVLFLTSGNIGYLGLGVTGAGTVAILSGILLLLSYRKIYWPARLFFPLIALAAITALALSSDGLHDSTITGYIVVILLAGMVIGQKAIPPALVLTLLGMWIVAYADMTGINTSALASHTQIGDVVVISMIQIIAAASLNGLMARLNFSIKASRTNEQGQIKSNQELRDLQAVLESRVTERTHSLELAAEVGRSVSQVRDLTSMMREAAETIRARFGLYYVQVYLTAPARNALVLQSGTGSVGVELVGRSHSLPIDTGSTNGRAVVEKRSVVISDTAASPTFRPNPLLPDTRSEMAVPLIAGENVVGVLDMQSSQPGALSEDGLPAFEALAGQLAIAIQNASLLAQAEQARAEVEAQARRLVRSNWKDYQDAIHKPEQTGFVFEGNAISPLADTDGYQPAVGENTISAPIAVTGEPVGTLTVEMEAQGQNIQSMQLVHAVARQVAQQIESLRLLESAERYRAEAEESSRRLTREGWQGYLEGKSDQPIAYQYDLNEVKPAGEEIALPAGESALTLPLKVRDETIGKLVVEGLGADDSEARGFASAVAERLGAHIESLRQFEQTQSALSQSEKLFEASRHLTEATDLQELVASTVNLLGIPGINRAMIFSFNYDSENNIESLDIIANWWNGTGATATPIGTRYGLDVIRMMPMFITPIPVFIDDAFTDKRIDATTLGLVKRLNIRTGAALPLHIGTHQIGAVFLEGEEPHIFKPEELRVFTSLAPQIATVLENRRQYERAQKQAERESTLNVIGQKIRSATSVEAVLQIAARELGHALGAPLTIAQLGLKDKQ